MNFEEALKEVEKHPEQYKVTLNYRGGLVMPNPREYYKNTRSFAAMKVEYDLLHAGEFTDEDLMKLAIAMRVHRKETFFEPMYLVPIIQIAIVGLLIFCVGYGH